MAGHSLQDYDRSHWERKVRPNAVAAIQPQCLICGFAALEKRRLIEADEVWLFPGPPHVTLIDVRPLCTRCHAAKDYAQLLRLVRSGSASKRREEEIKAHYCAVNACSEEQFAMDFKVALSRQKEIEDRYNPNCRPVVDYGRWGRSPDKPRLSFSERAMLKHLFDSLVEPIFVDTYKFSNLRSAVRTLQSIPLAQRGIILAELTNHLTDEEDDDPITERDEGVQFE
jgi:hypothetical protein